MKNLPAIVLFFILSFPALFAQQFVTVDSTKVQKLTSAVQYALTVLEKSEDSSYSDAVIHLKTWLNEMEFVVGSVNKKGELHQIRTRNSTKLVVLPDTSMDFFSSYGQSASLLFIPIFPDDERYIYLRYSSIDAFTEKELALQISHELYHLYQYTFHKERLFSKNDKESTILKEAEAWKFEAYLFLLVNPQYKKYIAQCDCRGDLLVQMQNFWRKNKQIDDRTIDYLFAYACPKVWFKSIINQK